MKRASTLFIAVFVFAVCADGQEPNAEQKPKTKLEAFEAQVGSVIVRGFSEVGTIQGEYGTSVTVQSREFTNAATGKKEFGVSIEVSGGGRLERKSSSYIDYDEIDSLIKGIDYIAKIRPDVTLLQNFQADYRTRGDFRASTYSSSGSVAAGVSSGSVGGASAFLSLADLVKLREMLTTAKQQLDVVRSAG